MFRLTKRLLTRRIHRWLHISNHLISTSIGLNLHHSSIEGAPLTRLHLTIHPPHSHTTISELGGPFESVPLKAFTLGRIASCLSNLVEMSSMFVVSTRGRSSVGPLSRSTSAQGADSRITHTLIRSPKTCLQAPRTQSYSHCWTVYKEVFGWSFSVSRRSWPCRGRLLESVLLMALH